MMADPDPANFDDDLPQPVRDAIDAVNARYTVDGEVVTLAQVGGDEFTGPCTYTFRIEDGALAQMCVIA